MTEPGLDDTKYTLTEHLGELRGRLAKAVLGIVLTTSGCLLFANEILDYSIEPLREVLRDRTRVETLLVHSDNEISAGISERLESHERLRFQGRLDGLGQVESSVRDAVDRKAPIDLILVDSSTIGMDGALVSDLLEDVEPSPYVVYLVQDGKSPIVQELQLEGALVVLSPPRKAVLNRIIRRAAASAGKSNSGDQLVVLSPLDPFFAYIKIALVCGLFLACPIWLYQAWRFIAPGLYANERKVVLPAVGCGSLLFISGGLFAYYLMFPVMFDFLVNQMMPSSLVGNFTVDKYLGLLLRLTVAFGVVFELPLVMALMSAVGLVSADTLRRFRRYAIVIAFVLGAFLTPADPLSQLMMSIPLVLFYELGIVLAVFAGKRRTDESLETLSEEA